MADSASETTAPKSTAMPSGLIVVMEAFRLLHAAVWPAMIVACIYFGITVPVRESKGQKTDLTVAYQIIGNLKLDVLISYAAAGTFGVLWRKERKTRVEAVAREHKRVEVLERRLDPNRTSSGFEE